MVMTCWPVKAWKCQSGPDSLCTDFRAPQPVKRWESGFTVGNFTHQLLATPSLQLACTCHRCPQIKLCGHRHHATSAVCPHVRRYPFKQTHVCASAGNGWMCMVTTGQHVHVSVSHGLRSSPTDFHSREASVVIDTTVTPNCSPGEGARSS